MEKHEERLKKKKIVDELERKYLERDIEREEMGSDYEEEDDSEYHAMLGMEQERVEKLVRSRIEKHKINPTAVDDELDPNAFNPIKFIIRELKAAHEIQLREQSQLPHQQMQREERPN